MHRPRYYRNPAVYHNRSDPNSVRFGYNSASQMARNTYRGPSPTPFSPAHNRFVDRSKYVWTAKQQPQPQPSQPVAQSPPQSAPPPPQRKQAPLQSIVHHPKHTTFKKTNPNCREISPLSVTVLDSPEAVANDIAEKLHEEKVYLISKVVAVLGVKKAIRLFYQTRQKEANGGILVQNGIRRRTPGGVFLTLLRESSFISPIEVEKIFQEIKRHEISLKSSQFHDAS